MVGQVAGGGRTEKPLLKAGNSYHKFKVKRNCWPKVGTPRPAPRPSAGCQRCWRRVARCLSRSWAATRPVLTAPGGLHTVCVPRGAGQPVWALWPGSGARRLPLGQPAEWLVLRRCVVWP